MMKQLSETLKNSKLSLLLALTLYINISCFCQNVVYSPLFTNTTFQKTVNVALPVGTIAANGSASNGSANYSIPITVPAGTNGITPSLTIGYNSMAGNSSLGTGWNIQGLSMITRVQKSIYLDGSVQPVNLNNTDVFSLDGERILSKSGTYGADLSTYGKESDDFGTITSYGVVGDGPQYFIYESKDGIKYEYGNTIASRFLSSDLSKVLFWRLNRIIYKDGNYMLFDYFNSNSESNIKEVQYTGNTSQVYPFNKITFVYAIRTDKNTTHEAGTPMKATQLLTNIVIKTDGNVSFKEYELKYANNNTSSFLNEIIEKGSDGIALNSTIFKYGDEPTNFSTSTTTVGQNEQQHFMNGDVNGDGYSDYIGLNNTVINNIVYTTSFTVYQKDPTELNNNFTAVHTENLPAGYEVFVNRDWGLFNIRQARGPNHTKSTGDWNGDGLADIILVKTSGTGSSRIMEEFRVYESPNYTTPIVKAPYTNGDKVNTSGNYYLLGDFNGDTKMDILTMLKGSQTWYNTAIYYGGGPYWYDTGVSGTPFFNETDWSSCDQINVMDFNGDGKDDIMLIKDGNCEIMTFTDLQTAKRIYFGGFPTKWHHLFFGDFNGDGKTDMLHRTDKDDNNAAWYKAISTGTGWIETPFTFSKVPDINNAYFGDQLLISDYNGDGKTDIAHLWNYWSGTNLYSKTDMYYSKGDDFYSEQYLFNDKIMTNPKYIFTFDSNGDGRPEILNGVLYTSPKQLLFIKKEGKERMLQKVKNGFDHDIEFVYKRMTQTSNFYTRGSVTSYPLNNVQMPINLVSEFKSENGIGGFATTTFSYEEAKFQRTGKAFLGFKIVNSSNLATGFRTASENEFNTTYYITLPKKVSKYLISNNSLLNESTNTNEVVAYFNTKRFWSRVNSTYENRAFEGQFISNTLTYDTYGNVTNSTTNTNNIETKTIVSQYGQFGTPIPAKLTSETITNTRSGQTPYAYTNSYSYNTLGQLIGKIDFVGLPKQVQTTFGYNILGNLTTTTISPTGMLARTSSKIYDVSGRFVTSSTNTLNQTETYVNDVRWGKPTAVSFSTGLNLGYSYDAFGRLTATNDPNRGITINTGYQWDINNTIGTVHKKSIIHPGKPDEVEWYDILDRVKRKDTEVFGSSWSSQYTTYDNRGNAATTTLPYKTGETVLTTTNTYDAYNRLQNVSNTIGTTSYSYSYSLGNLTTSVTNPAGQVQTNVTDGAGRIVSSTDYGGTLYFAYFSHGKIKNTMRSSTVLTSSVYDEYARQTQLFDINAGTTLYTTDALGQVTGMVTPTNQSLSYSYDVLGRKTSYVRPEGSTTYTYYPSGSGGSTNQLNTVSTYGNITEQYNYDAIGRISSKIETIDAIPNTSSFTYNIYDDLSSQTYPGGFVCNYTYDANGYLNTIKNGNNTVTLYTQTSTNGLGNTTGYSMGNGKSSSINYYFGTPTNFTTTGLQNLTLNWNYQSGNLTSRIDGIKTKTENFTYDNLNRLLTSSGTGLTTLTSAYNSNGNITSKTDAGNYTYSASKINAVTEVTNGQGNIPTITQDIVYTSFYQPLNIIEGINRIDIKYDADDQRIKSVRQQNNLIVNTRYYFGNYEKDITAGTTRHIYYIPSPTGMACIVERIGTADTYHYTYTDHLGSILTVTNNSGVVEFEQNFDAWGRNRNATTWTYASIPAPQVWLYRGYTGHEHLPEFKLINMNGRLYDPIVGRMLSPDNNVQMPDYTQNYNRYSYALNNPLRFTDPNGEEVITLATIGIAMLISAATYTAVHLATHEFSFEGWNWGAFAGAVVAGGVGGFVSPALTAAGVGGFANGAITGAASGFASGLTGGLIDGQRGKELWKKVGLSAATGAAIGGIVDGIKASIDGNRFWDGANVEYITVAEDAGLNHVIQDGTNNCTCATGEMVTNAQGAGRTQGEIRTWMGGDKDLNPLPDIEVVSRIGRETGLNTYGFQPGKSIYAAEALNQGTSVVMTIPGSGTVAHSVAVKGSYIKQVTRVNGKISTSLMFKIYDPAVSSPYYVSSPWVNKYASTVFAIWR
jgi:RHS repeat-associated protein